MPALFLLYGSESVIFLYEKDGPNTSMLQTHFGFHPTFSRQDKVKASIPLLIRHTKTFYKEH